MGIESCKPSEDRGRGGRRRKGERRGRAVGEYLIHSSGQAG